MSEAITLARHVLSDLSPDDTLQRTLVDDREEQVLICLVVPLRRHDCLVRESDFLFLSNALLCKDLVLQMGCCDVGGRS